MWILIVVAVLAGIRLLVFPKSESGAKGGPPKASISPIKIAVAQLVGASEQIRLSGAVLTPDQIILQSEISGLLIYVYLGDGKQVAAGTVLYRLRDDEYQAQCRKILANLGDARRIQRLESDLQKVQGTTVDALSSFFLAVTEYSDALVTLRLVELECLRVSGELIQLAE